MNASFGAIGIDDFLECRCRAVGAGNRSGRGESHEGKGRQRDLVPHVVIEVRSIVYWNELLMRIEDPEGMSAIYVPLWLLSRGRRVISSAERRAEASYGMEVDDAVLEW